MFSIEDMYRAYRKAKHEAFSDATQPSNLEFAKYEQSLHENLVGLQRKLKNKRVPWHTRKGLVSGWAYLPKMLQSANSRDQDLAHFSSGDQTQDWVSRFGAERETAEVDFRLIIVPSVDFQIISALWVMEVGRTYDAALNDELAYGNRPRRAVTASIDDVQISDDSFSLFQPYFSGYKRWRENGLKCMRAAVKRGDSVVAITMDARKYYHSISPKFLLSPSFLKANQIVLTDKQFEFTKQFIEALQLWHRLTPEFSGSARGAVPVGLSASKVIANVLLAEFDREFTARISCEYYGRYVDDVFLVLKGPVGRDAASVMRHIRSKMDGFLVLDRPRGSSIGLRLTLPYLEESQVIFSGAKQKIFSIGGPHGLDLVQQISDQVRKSSSEYRLIPSLGEVDQVLTGALLASPDAELEADTLRKAEAMSIRRHGLSIATRNLDGYAKDVDPKQWESKRLKAYGLILRHVVTPTGTFQYMKYVVRVFGVMIACGDWKAATELLDKLNVVLLAVRDGIDSGEYGDRLDSMRDVYRRSLLEVAIAASTVGGFKHLVGHRRILRRLDPNRQAFVKSVVTEAVSKNVSRHFLMADLGRRPYKDYWYNENPSDRQPRIPNVPFLEQLSRLLSGMKKHIVRELNDPYWPAIAFATRPPSLSEMCLMMPSLMNQPGGMAKALLAIRGAGVPSASARMQLANQSAEWLDCVIPCFSRDRKLKIAVPSYLTTDAQWKSALRGKPDLSVQRYERLTTLINSIIQRIPDVDYIALPECSVPFTWAFSISRSLAKIGVSLICGIEPSPRDGRYRNDALVSLVTNYGGYRSSLVFRQPKLELAHREARDVRKAKPKLKFKQPRHPMGRPIYSHGDFIFSVLLCSDLTNIDNRRVLQGEIDALFVLEWNPDVDTFSYLVESASHDLHVPVIQINNRLYGDSRVRAPFKDHFKRDVVRVKGGDTDFYAVASIDPAQLRRYQKNPRPSNKVFKPLPIGFKLSSRRTPR